jgi:hypothetical protein
VIDFRDDRVRQEWESGKVDPLLESIFLDAAQHAETVLQIPLIITCIWRSAEEDALLNGSGVHKVWRAIDVHADTWSDPKIGALAEYINSLWIYDPLRPSYKVALWEPHGTGPHAHFQVCHSSLTISRPGTVSKPEFVPADTYVPRQFDTP